MSARHPDAAVLEYEELDEISCDSCGRSFMTANGPAMIAVIKGPCPDCGGRFELVVL